MRKPKGTGQERGYSDFVVYVDERADHSLTSINPDYPVFVLAFCIFYKGHYLSKVVPQLQQLKFDYFGHDLVILHEHEIRKEKGDFSLFRNRAEKNEFMGRLGSIIEGSNFILASCVIEKHKMQRVGESAMATTNISMTYRLKSGWQPRRLTQQGCN